ncbi:Avr9/Cf-9 rapidly elicited protein 137 [Striga asiatica]|uniref:Avr9/Cf-9 rapidly elicited protein 137 n=1 Tax=Striga asiatica TaxID=4170 RepID=A0A5A7RJ44_STRAF|nr:Avr9/Cf-9 rapidly elicited protein 137 [Striga asiatica]
MVGFKGLAWLPEPAHRRFTSNEKKCCSNLGILAFETARIMSRLVSLYRSITDEETSRMRNDVFRSRGVQFLNSDDEDFLLSLACAEKLEELDRVAAAVACLGKRCDDFGLNRFAVIYTDLKLGIVNLGKSELYGSRAAEKRVRKMEKLASTTSSLHSAADALANLEISDRKLKQLNHHQLEVMKIDMDDFSKKLENQRKEVLNLRETSLWSQTFDKSVDLMARTVCVVYLRICSVFGPQPMNLRQKIVPYSGPLLTKSKPVMVRFHSQRSIDFPDEDKTGHGPDGVIHLAGPETVGGSGLTTLYANIIILAGKYLSSKSPISQDEREELYRMLPENLRSVLRSKLAKKMKTAENDELLAEGWREAMEEMMGWLGPMARDSVMWLMERNVVEKMRFDGCGKTSSVLLCQTLHFADREKTEAAIAEVLVGLSCIFRFENRRAGA